LSQIILLTNDCQVYILISVGDKNNQPPRVKGERSSDYGSWV
jgi:hypothetical protein